MAGSRSTNRVISTFLSPSAYLVHNSSFPGCCDGSINSRSRSFQPPHPSTVFQTKSQGCISLDG